MGAKEPRSVTVGLSTAQLDAAGIPDSLDDYALADIVDDFMRSYPAELRLCVEEWINDHPDEDEPPFQNLEGQPEFNGAFG